MAYSTDDSITGRSLSKTRKPSCRRNSTRLIFLVLQNTTFCTFDSWAVSVHTVLSWSRGSTSTGCGRKKWTPKVFRCFLSNRLEFEFEISQIYLIKTSTSNCQVKCDSVEKWRSCGFFYHDRIPIFQHLKMFWLQHQFNNIIETTQLNNDQMAEFHCHFECSKFSLSAPSYNTSLQSPYLRNLLQPCQSVPVACYPR